MISQNKKIILDILNKCWSLDTSSKWTPENPAKGQCSVTALVINDIFGGDIMKTQAGDDWHYYNYIDYERIDFTVSQYPDPINYSDIKCKRVDACLDTDLKKFQFMSSEFRKLMKYYPGLELSKTNI
jgi:hypothetical protein